MAQRTFTAGCEGGPDLGGHCEEGCGRRKPGQSMLNPEELDVTNTWERHKRAAWHPGAPCKEAGLITPLFFNYGK